jgi:Skp family chaperone for outer membrane proteins
MKTIAQWTFLLAVAGLLSFSPAARAAGVVNEQRIATVDLQKVFEKYYKTVRSQAGLKQEAMEMQKERQDMVDIGKKAEVEWQKLVDKSTDPALSAEEKERSKKAAEDKLREVKSQEQNIQEYDRASAARLQETQRRRHDDIVKEIRNVLNAVAKANSYTLVLDVSGESANTVPVVIYSAGVNDITDAVIKDLNATAVNTPADDSLLKSSKDSK